MTDTAPAQGNWKTHRNPERTLGFLYLRPEKPQQSPADANCWFIGAPGSRTKGAARTLWGGSYGTQNSFASDLIPGLISGFGFSGARACAGANRGWRLDPRGASGDSGVRAAALPGGRLPVDARILGVR